MKTHLPRYVPLIPVVTLLVACQAPSTPPSSDTSQTTSTRAPHTTNTPKPAPLRTTIVGAEHGKLTFGEPVTVQAQTGKIKNVKAASRKGNHEITGHYSHDHRTWTSATPLPPDTTWKITATGGRGGQERMAVTGTRAAVRAHAQANIGVDKTVGVAAPIIVNFDKPVTNKAGVEKYLRVLIRPHGSHQPWKPAQGSWGWLPDNKPNSTVHFRTKKYWPANSDVHVTLPLATVNWGNGVTGQQDFDWTFHIGRRQVVKADARKHHISIYRNGKKKHTYKASFGLDSVLDRNTLTGTHVVTGKLQTVEMKSERWGYDLIEHWAVRINNNGEFIHANPSTVWAQGHKNVSHGCINLSTPDAAAYFKTAIYGDPVEITGTRTRLAKRRTAIYDWALTWNEWKKLSALN